LRCANLRDAFWMWIVGAHSLFCSRDCRFLLWLQDGWTLIHLAAIKGHIGCVEKLIEAGADVNAEGMVRRFSLRNMRCIVVVCGL